MLSTATWDKLRVAGLAALGAYAIREWFKSSVRRRGQLLTRRLIIRTAISAAAGSIISLITLALAHYSSNHEALALPITPGFLVGAITIGVHRDDRLLLYVTGFLNAALYGTIVFSLYPMFRRDKNTKLP